MARKKKSRNQDCNNISIKLGKEKLKKISEHINKADDLMGDFGDGAANKQTLVAAIEDLNVDIHDGKKVTNWFNSLNNTTLPNIQKAFAGLSEKLELLDSSVVIMEKYKDE